jgi:pimeloyl-ACP methyl ester carboxylesterase
MRIRIGDVFFFFDVEGAKLRPDGSKMREVPTLLLLHGGPGFDHSTFKPDFSALADVAQVVYLDHRGQGRSERGASERWNLDQWADDVRAFCEALEIERPIVLGQSFGGMVAMCYATRHPEHPGKLVLSSTAARVRFDRSLAKFERLGGPRAREVAERFFENPGSNTITEFRTRCFPLYNRRDIGSEWTARTILNQNLTVAFFKGELRSFNFLPALSRVRCPTLVMAGEDDPITPLADSEDIANAIPAGLARLARFPNAGHGVFRDTPEAFFKSLREFITS